MYSEDVEMRCGDKVHLFFSGVSSFPVMVAYIKHEMIPNCVRDKDTAVLCEHKSPNKLKHLN